jgi:hypothetical protein
MEPSAAAASLVRTLDRARAITLACVADFDDADLRRGAEFGLNPAAWILGHLAYSELRLCLHFAFGVPVDVTELGATFGRGAARPAPETLPGLDDLRALLADAHARTLAMLEVADAEDLEHPPVNVLSAFPDLPCRSDVVLQAALHESQHAGQLFVLRKLLGKPAIANYR